MNRENLLAGIKKVLPATSKKGIVPGWDTIVLYDGEMLAFNDKICVSTLIEDMPEDMKIAVTADDLRKTLQSISEDEVTLAVEDDKLVVASTGTEAKIDLRKTMDATLNSVDNIDAIGGDFEDLPDDFSTAINLCKFAVSDNFNDDKSLFALKVIDSYVFASDRVRMSVYTLSKSIKDTLLLPKTILNELESFSPTGYRKKDGWVHFVNKDEAYFSCRHVPDKKDKFPDCKAVLDKFEGSKTIELPDKFQAELEKALVVFDETLNSSKNALIEIKDGLVKTTIKRKVTIIKKTEIEDKSIEAKFNISAAFLAEILSLTNKFQLSESTTKFQSGSFEHIIAFTQ